MKKITLSALLYSLLVLFVVPSISFAQVVTSTNDIGAGTLREAIDNAVGGEVITFNIVGAPPHVINLNSELIIDVPLIINGPGVEDLILDGGNSTRIFNIDYSTAVDIDVEIRDLVIQNGNSTGGAGTAGENGGGIFNLENLTLENCRMLNNTSGQSGGALATRGSVVLIQRCEFLNNRALGAFGGAIDYQPFSSVRVGSLTIEDSSFLSNSSGARGGALSVSQGAFPATNPLVDIRRTIFNRNSVVSDGARGGAIYNDNGSLTMIDIVISENSVTGDVDALGGGVYNNQSAGTTAFLNLLNASVTDNIVSAETATGGGFYFQGVGDLTPRNILTNITLSANIAQGQFVGFGPPFAFGGAIFLQAARVDLLASTVAYNVCQGPDGATLTGAAIFAQGTDPELRYRNNIIAGNTFVRSGGTRSTTNRGVLLEIPNCDEAAGGDSTSFQAVGTSNITDSNQAEDLCAPSFNAAFIADEMLGPLQNNGGFTLTHELLDGVFDPNPAIDAIPDGECLNVVSTMARRMDDPFDSSIQKDFYLISNPEPLGLNTLASNAIFHTSDDSSRALLVSPELNNRANTAIVKLIADTDITDASSYSSRITEELRGPMMTQNPTDGRPFPRPFDSSGLGTALCDVGSFELQSTASIIVAKISDPFDGMGFEFLGSNFPPGCDLDGMFTLDDFQQTSGCIVPQGTYIVEETNNQGFPFLTINCRQPAAIITPDIPNSLVSIEVVNTSETIVCTFTNSTSPSLTVSLQGTGTGSVLSNPSAIDCPDDTCTRDFTIGTDVTLTATPDPGSAFDGWSGDCPATVMNQTTITLNASSTCIATFSILPPPVLNIQIAGAGEGGVTSTPSGQIDCSNTGASDCDETYTLGDMVTLTAASEAGSVFNSWSGDSDCTADPTNPILSLTVNADTTCIATFDIEQISFDVMVLGPGTGGVTSTPPGQIDCSNTGASDCDETYNVGTMVTLTATPTADSMFVAWGGDSGCVGSPTNPVLSITVNADISCIAMFSLLPVPVVLDVTISGTGTGGVTSTPSGQIDCSNTGANDCDESYMLGTGVTITALPEVDSIFTGWSGDAECVGTPTNPILILTMNSDISCIATFIIDPSTQLVTLDLEIEGNGTGTVTSQPLGIDCPSDCTETVAPGTTFTLSAIPGPNSEFLGWSEDCVGQDTDTMIIVNTDSLCVATFILTNLSLNPILPGLDDNINVISAENASPGGNVAFTWARSTGSLTIGGRVCNGLELGLGNPRLLTIDRANNFGVATHIFYIPTFNDLSFQIQLQAIDIQTCRTSNIVPQIIRKDESG